MFNEGSPNLIRPNPASDPEQRFGLDDASGVLCVLASGSRGNCSVLVIPATPDTPRRVYLIDAGLSPRRTASLLSDRGIRPDDRYY